MNKKKTSKRTTVIDFVPFFAVVITQSTPKTGFPFLSLGTVMISFILFFYFELLSCSQQDLFETNKIFGRKDEFVCSLPIPLLLTLYRLQLSSKYFFNRSLNVEFKQQWTSIICNPFNCNKELLYKEQTI